MDINQIYTTIFPIGGIDDNNRYIKLNGMQINTIQLLEPAIKVNQMGVSKKDMSDQNNMKDKYGYRIPMISIDGNMLEPVNITYFKLDYRGFLPLVTVDFVDPGNEQLSTIVIKDGSIVSVYIGGYGDELYYKPIRQDFIITNVKKNGGSDQNSGGYLRYRVQGKLNIPYGFRKEAWCNGDATSMQALFNLCVYTGLGFATNFTKAETPDVMGWVNDDATTYFDFMNKIINHACYSPNTFFTGFVDQYNVLNFVEVHSLLSHGGKKTDVPAMMYSTIPPTRIPNYDGKSKKTPENQIIINKDRNETAVSNSQQQLTYYYLSNNEYFNGWTNFIEEYTEINNGSSTTSDGYINHVIFEDHNQGDWGFSNSEFNLRPIDNLEREEKTQKIKPLGELCQDSYIPLNLMHMTKEDYQNAENDTSVDDMSKVESFTNYGEVDTTNTFKRYYFAEAQNKYQMMCLKKCGLNVILQNYNPSVTKFSRIWVDIYDKNLTSNTQLSKSEANNNDNLKMKLYKEKKNKNIIFYKDEGRIEVKKYHPIEKNFPRGIFNRALSGWYVVTEMTIFYSPEDNNLKMRLKLNRIEYQPAFKDEYYVAQKGVEKYKEEHLIENLLESKDDASYALDPTNTSPEETTGKEGDTENKEGEKKETEENKKDDKKKDVTKTKK